MTTLTSEARHPALVDRMLEMVLAALAMISPPPQQAEEADDIDWEDGEPEEETRAA